MVNDRKGRQVQALTPAEVPTQRILGEHLRKQGQRVDHLAAHYLDDPFGYWRLVRLADAMSADVLSNSTTVKIPTKG